MLNKPYSTIRKKHSFNLLENAFDFINSSLSHISLAKENQSPSQFKYGLLHLSLAVELLLKERLKRSHQLFIYSNIDKYKPVTKVTKTVSFSTAIERLKFILGDDLTKLDSGRLALAKDIRNQILHYEYEIIYPSVYNDFANLMNFVVQFYDKFLCEGDHDKFQIHINRKFQNEEELLCEAFNDEIVFYNGLFMPNRLENDIKREQGIDTLIIDGKEYSRIPYGDPSEWGRSEYDYSSIPCHDCFVVRGQIHLYQCDMEKCPKCKGQFFGCDCNVEYTFPE